MPQCYSLYYVTKTSKRIFNSQTLVLTAATSVRYYRYEIVFVIAIWIDNNPKRTCNWDSYDFRIRPSAIDRETAAGIS